MPIKKKYIHFRSSQKKENYLFFGISIYTFGILLPMFFPITFIGVGCCFLGLLFMASSFHNLSLALLKKNKYFNVIFKLYMIWSILLFLRGIFGLVDLRDFMSYIIGYRFGLIPFVIMPMVVMFGHNIYIYKNIFKWIFVYSNAFILLSVVYLIPVLDSPKYGLEYEKYVVWIEFLTKSLYLSCSLVLLTIPYQKIKIQITSLLAFCLALLISTIFARRNLIFSIGIAGFFTIIFYSFSRIGTKKKIWFFVIIAVLMGVSYKYLNKNSTMDKFEFFTNRLEEKLNYSRVYIEQNMFDDFSSTPLDYIWGRGGNGSYTTAIYVEINGNQRRSMETGYLAMILKGGVIYLLLHLLLLIPAIYKGLFQSNNFLVKAGALLILISILELYPAGFNGATLYNLILWVSVGLCYSPEIRKMNNIKLESIINR